MKNNARSTVMFIPILFVVVSVVFIALISWQYLRKAPTETDLINILPTEEPLPPITPWSEVIHPTKVYENTQYHYQFSYPRDWMIEEIVGQKKSLAGPYSKTVRLSSPDRPLAKTFMVNIVTTLPEKAARITLHGIPVFYAALPDGERYYAQVPGGTEYIELSGGVGLTGIPEDDEKILAAFNSFELTE